MAIHVVKFYCPSSSICKQLCLLCQEMQGIYRSVCSVLMYDRGSSNLHIFERVHLTISFEHLKMYLLELLVRVNTSSDWYM